MVDIDDDAADISQKPSFLGEEEWNGTFVRITFPWNFSLNRLG